MIAGRIWLLHTRNLAAYAKNSGGAEMVSCRM